MRFFRLASKKTRLFILSAMIAFSLFFIVTEKLSAPGDHFKRTEDVFSLKLHEELYIPQGKLLKDVMYGIWGVLCINPLTLSVSNNHYPHRE